MHIIINNSSMVPIYEQIIDQIKSAIIRGELQPDTVLPSVRSLSKELKISALLLPFMRYIIGDAPSIKENLNVIYLIFLFNTASSYFFSYRGALLQTDQKSYIVTGLNYIQTIAQSIIQIIYLLLTHEYYGYLIIQAIGMILYNFSISYVAKKQYPYIVGKEIKPLSQIERNKISKDVGNLMITRLASINDHTCSTSW